MFHGWAIVGWTALAVAAATASVLADGVSEAALHALLRTTAETSLGFFLLAFVASALHRAVRARWTAWLLANRRQLGVSMAVSHGVHGWAIGMLSGWSWLGYWRLAGPVTAIAGGLGFLMLALMVATSFDVTAAWIGPRAWARLHTVGVHFLWFIFFVTLAPGVVESPARVVPVGLLLATLAVRLRWPVRRPVLPRPPS